ncbi:MAG: phosphoribosylglycinamide synthetase C domain-containing protein [Candidatus Nitrosoabyssus spongiisocia]|nr:MAG: phosphoribosylglycinamide synthetase C domain-containing protein [Nitrosopumilaceae archaeon AB1(1)]
MVRDKFLIVGSGGRESAFAQRLVKENIQLYAVISHKNPLITHCVEESGGTYLVADSSDPCVVLNFVKEHAIDYTFVSADQPLANGVVDILLENNFKAIGGNKKATRIEWDKIYSIQMMQKVCPEFTPFYKIISNTDSLKDAISEFESKGLDIVVKPQGLTGGKGVKVMPEHLSTYQDCINYASSLLKKTDRDEKVLLIEKLQGIEFTIMGITDGKHLIVSPATYDYPFRHEDDMGAGTGGMGCFTDSDGKLPFMSDKDLDDCKLIMQRIIDEIKSKNLLFNGVLNGGFFKTQNGIKFMEFNGRFGDPEGLNILSILDESFSKLIIHLWNKTLSEDAISFLKKASVTKYLVAKEYPDESSDIISFTINEKAITDLGVKIFFASCIKTGPHMYETLKKSRVVAFSVVSDTIEDASSRINKAIDTHVKGKLEYRRDIGSEKSLKKLKRIMGRW